MSIQDETLALRRHLHLLARDFDVALLRRYTLRPLTHGQLSLYRRFRIYVGRMLRELGLRRDRHPWIPTLTAVPENIEPLGTILIWAVGCEKSKMRPACDALREMFDRSLGRYDIVLVTEIADFAFYSRLPWLVEYVPEPGAVGVQYRERKERYLAWRYRDALAIPLVAGLAEVDDVEGLLNG